MQTQIFWSLFFFPAVDRFDKLMLNFSICCTFYLISFSEFCGQKKKSLIWCCHCCASGHCCAWVWSLAWELSHIEGTAKKNKKKERKEKKSSDPGLFLWPAPKAPALKGQAWVSPRGLGSSSQLPAQAGTGAEQMSCGCHQRAGGSRHSRLCFLCRLRVTEGSWEFLCSALPPTGKWQAGKRRGEGRPAALIPKEDSSLLGQARSYRPKKEGKATLRPHGVPGEEVRILDPESGNCSGGVTVRLTITKHLLCARHRAKNSAAMWRQFGAWLRTWPQWPKTGLKPNFDAHLLCDLEQVTSSLCASVTSLIKWE